MPNNHVEPLKQYIALGIEIEDGSKRHTYEAIKKFCCFYYHISIIEELNLTRVKSIKFCVVLQYMSPNIRYAMTFLLYIYFKDYSHPLFKFWVWLFKFFLVELSLKTSKKIVLNHTYLFPFLFIFKVVWMRLISNSESKNKNVENSEK